MRSQTITLKYGKKIRALVLIFYTFLKSEIEIKLCWYLKCDWVLESSRVHVLYWIGGKWSVWIDGGKVGR